MDHLSTDLKARTKCLAEWVVGLVPEMKLTGFKSEANQLVAIFNVSRTTAQKGVGSTINNQNSTISSRKVS